MELNLKYAKGVYRDAEDSWMLQEFVEKYSKGKRVLDIGTGTGIQAITAAKCGAKEVLATDINPGAVKLAKENAIRNNVKIKVIQSNLFENITGKFDLIIFNPPYLPSEAPQDLAWSGGAPLIETFIKEAKQHLTKNGKIIFVFSSHTKLASKEIKILKKQKFFFEELFVGLCSNN